MRLIERYHLLRKRLSQSRDEREARNIALELLVHVTGSPHKNAIFTAQNRNIDPAEETQLSIMEGRILEGEPMQYVLGWAYFDGLRLKVGPGVLIPRPETEELIDHALRRIEKPVQVLDVGTGSGCIALAIQQRRPTARVEAWDIAHEALEIARQNARKLHLEVTFKAVDLLNPGQLRYGPPFFDLILSNPPYVLDHEWRNLEPHVRDHEPRSALVAHNTRSPLEVYDALLSLARERLAPGGWIGAELNPCFADGLAESFGKQLVQLEVVNDMNGHPRFIFGQKQGH